MLLNTAIRPFQILINAVTDKWNLYRAKDRPLLGFERDEEFEGAGDDFEFDGEALCQFSISMFRDSKCDTSR
jgi:hypothetical protein